MAVEIASSSEDDGLAAMDRALSAAHDGAAPDTPAKSTAGLHKPDTPRADSPGADTPSVDGKKNRTHTVHIALPLCVKLLSRHLEDWETFELGAYVP